MEAITNANSRNRQSSVRGYNSPDAGLVAHRRVYTHGDMERPITLFTRGSDPELPAGDRAGGRAEYRGLSI